MKILVKTILACIAYHTPPWLTVRLHKWRGVRFKDHSNVFIGMHVDIDHNHPEMVVIGSDVTIASGSRITAHFHPPKNMESVLARTKSKINIGSNVYIGVDCIILAGVTIHDWVVIGAGAVVTKDMPSGAIAAGNPARIIKTFTPPK